ncbi:hypothetical protein CSOJ01_12446 [Colletotrichum sojae]|uniref:Extracellular membrane protein CFEM domain-containing protein n=1 Tax=Colletotrichum sojae TaxID=2175907 RepID=A0A8H6IV83_9PEZI|nr:hypothetical protein CSOJ01_12446 [Colletotrichum sojae]
MRSYQSAPALLALLATAASALSPARLHCLRSRNADLARQSACGMAGSVAHCLDMIPDDFTQADMEACWVNAGCELAEAVVEAQWALDRCDEYGNLAAELRARFHAPVQARATTTADETTAAATTATAASTAATATAAATGTSLTCSTTTTTSTTVCPVASTGASSGKTLKSGCYPTVVSFETCAAGMLCKDDPEGVPSCLVMDNTLGGGGIAVAIFFAVAITGAIGTITFLCCRERKEKKRIAAKAEAAAIAREANMKKRPTVEVQPAESNAHQPLMQHGDNQPYDTGNPFSDRTH